MRARRERDISNVLNEVSNKLRDLEDAVNTLESDSSYGQVDEGSLRNIYSAASMARDISSLFTSIASSIKRREKEKEQMFNIPSYEISQYQDNED